MCTSTFPVKPQFHVFAVPQLTQQPVDERKTVRGLIIDKHTIDGLITTGRSVRFDRQARYQTVVLHVLRFALEELAFSNSAPYIVSLSILASCKRTHGCQIELS